MPAVMSARRFKADAFCVSSCMPLTNPHVATPQAAQRQEHADDGPAGESLEGGQHQGGGHESEGNRRVHWWLAYLEPTTKLTGKTGASRWQRVQTRWLRDASAWQRALMAHPAGCGLTSFRWQVVHVSSRWHDAHWRRLRRASVPWRVHAGTPPWRHSSPEDENAGPGRSRRTRWYAGRGAKPCARVAARAERLLPVTRGAVERLATGVDGVQRDVVRRVQRHRTDDASVTAHAELFARVARLAAGALHGRLDGVVAIESRRVDADRSWTQGVAPRGQARGRRRRGHGPGLVAARAAPELQVTRGDLGVDRSGQRGEKNDDEERYGAHHSSGAKTRSQMAITRH